MLYSTDAFSIFLSVFPMLNGGFYNYGGHDHGRILGMDGVTV